MVFFPPVSQDRAINKGYSLAIAIRKNFTFKNIQLIFSQEDVFKILAVSIDFSLVELFKIDL